MIVLYDKAATTFDDNGICVLSPVQASVAEEAGGKYELHLEHPFDDAGKFRLLAEEYLIKAPVPVKTIPQISLPETKILKTNKATDLYSKLPVTKYPSKTEAAIQNVRDHALDYAWTLVKYYNRYEYTTHAGKIWQAKEFNFKVAPGSDSAIWGYVEDVDATGYHPVYDPGVISESLAANETVTKIADYSGEWVRVMSLRGKSGYVRRADIDETTQTVQRTIPAQTITEQVFRIYQVQSNEAEQTVSVDARHISYDFKGNALYSCVFKEADPMTAIAIMQGSLMIEDDRTIASDITDATVSKDWSFKNPINALLDPSDGLVPMLKANLVRNNRDFYLLDGSNARTGITIKYGVNMKGVNWKRNSENTITRIVPRCFNGTDEYVYLDNLYVDSPNASDFPFVRIEVMDCQYTVGGQDEQPDGTVITWVLDEDNVAGHRSVKTAMQADAEKRFSEDHVDGVDVTLDVEFILMGDTAEFAQYKALQTVCLYDKVRVISGKSAVEITAQVTEYQWDCLRGRYYSIKVGTVNSFNRRVPGYRVVNQSITYDKLSPDLIARIRTSNASGSADSGSGGGTSPGGDGIAAVNVIDSLTSTSTADALSANMGRVLNGHFVSLGTANDPVTDLADIPLNSIGNAVLAAAISPSGALRSVSFWKTGSSATRYTIFVVDQYANRAYFQVNYDGTLTGWDTVTESGDLSGLAKKIVLNNTIDTWAKVWEKINTLDIRETATLYAVSGAYSILSGGANDTLMVGTITRVGQTDQFEIIAKSTNNRLICARITGASSSSAGTYEEVNYSSRQIGTNDSPVTSLANIPLNSSGNVIMAASISPTGSQTSFSYWKHGNDETRWAVFCIHQQNNKAYINSYISGAYSGWKELVTDKISTFRSVSSSRNVTFTIPSACHANVMIGTTNIIMFMSSQNVLSTSTMPSGFSASNSGTSVTITWNNDTAYVCSVIIVPA